MPGPVVNEGSPQDPKTRKGAVRVEMEKMLADAATTGLRSLVVRAGDFLGNSAGSWFAAAMVKPGNPVRSVTYPGKREAGHAWAFLPDLAETIVRLAKIEIDLPDFDVFHFGGHWVEPGVEIAHAVLRAAERPDLPIRRFPWPLVYVGAPFVPLMRELIEMRYLWQAPLRLENRKLVTLLGSEPHTPLDDAVRQTLQAMRCL
jgi:nucleoside-diphosphate-sugar epimerase